MFHKLKAGVLAALSFLGLMVAAPAAFAQATLPAGVEAAIGNSGEMLELGATTVIIAMVAFWGLRKLGSKMGWW